MSENAVFSQIRRVPAFRFYVTLNRISVGSGLTKPTFQDIIWDIFPYFVTFLKNSYSINLEIKGQNNQ